MSGTRAPAPALPRGARNSPKLPLQEFPPQSSAEGGSRPGRAVSRDVTARPPEGTSAAGTEPRPVDLQPR